MDENKQLCSNEEYLSEWLREAQATVVLLNKRSRCLLSLCPNFSIESERQAELRNLVKLNREIANRCERIRAVEAKADHGVGCGSLLGCAPVRKDTTLLTILVLAGAQLHSGLRTDCRTVSDIMALVAPGAVPSLAVRDLFRFPHGWLLPWIHIESGPSLSQCKVDMNDAGVAVVCGKDPTDREHAYSVLGLNESRKRQVP